VPDDVVAGLGGGKRPVVLVTVNGHSYRTTVASMGGRYLGPLSAENRERPETTSRSRSNSTPLAAPSPSWADLDAALDPEARAYFNSLAFTHRQEWVRWIEEAKKPETRTARVAKTVAALREGHPNR
jgi:hypothetical protein